MSLDDIAALNPGNKPLSYSEQQTAIATLTEDVQYYQQELEYYKQSLAADPWKNNPQQSHDERFADRMLKQRMPDTEQPAGQRLWFTRSDVLELLALIPSLARKDYRRFVRDWEDIETLSQGGGNKQIVQSRQERLLFEIQLCRSVPDVPLTGMTERVLLATKRQEIDQTMRSPALPKGGKGFVDSIMSRFQ